MVMYRPEHERAERQAIRAAQFRALRKLIETTWANNEFYRSRWTASGVDINAVTSLDAFSATIPTVAKKDFVADQEVDPPFGRRHASIVRRGKPYTISVTGGTSGQGIEIHLQTSEEMKSTEEIYRYQYNWAGLKQGDLIFLAMPITMMAGGRIELAGALGSGLSVAAIGNYDVARKLQLMRRFRPVGLIGNTSYFGHLLAASDSLPPTPGLTHLFSGGEGSGWSYFERLEEGWRARVFDRYGSTQSRNDHMFSCEAGVGKPGRPGMLHNVEPLVLFEVIDPATGRHVRDGEAGEIVITSLYHFAAPLIRCRTGDRAIYHDPDYCSCGRPFGGVEIASIGRIDDMRKVKGVNIWPQAVEDVIFAKLGIDDFEIVLTSSAAAADIATARIMTIRALGSEEAASLRDVLAQALRDKVGIGFEIEIVAPGSLARSELKARRWRDERLHRRGANRKPPAPRGDELS